MTPDQLRGLANTTGMIYDITMCREIFRAHAAALEEIERLKADTLTAVQAAHDESYQMRKEIERLNGERDELKELLIEKTRVERGYLDAFVKAERRAERLKFHAEAMAHYTDCYKDKWPDSGARQTLDEYRAEFKGE